MKPLCFATVLLSAASAFADSANVVARGSMNNARLRFERDKVGHVAFMGGSITEMNGYRPMLEQFLAKRFPETKFTFTNAGIASTCSTTGAFRLAEDVLSKGPVDLFVVEFAVNDDQDAGHARRECVRGLEGILRHVRTHKPNADIVVVFFVNEGMLNSYDAGKTPLAIEAHEDTAARYGVPTVNVAKEVWDRLKAGTLTWKEYGGVHPGKPGNSLAASLVEQLLTAAWKEPPAADAKPAAHAVPDKPIDEKSYTRGRFVDPKDAKAGAGWTLGAPEWKSIKGAFRDRFKSAVPVCSETAGAELTLEFTGTAVGAYVLAGPDAGTAEASIDGGPFVAVDLYHRFSGGLHYPRTVMFAADLADGPHTLRLRVAEKSYAKSTGRAIRILKFAVN